MPSRRNPNKERTPQPGLEPHDARWRMYDLLLVELRHLHLVWVDTFRILITFNSILLPGSAAALAVVLQGRNTLSTLTLVFIPLAVLVLCAIGVLTTTVMMISIYRVRQITNLRQQEVRNLEMEMLPLLPVHPFLEGFVQAGGVVNDPVARTLPKVKRMRWYWFRGILTYDLIGSGFILAYFFLGAASIFLSK